MCPRPFTRLVAMLVLAAAFVLSPAPVFSYSVLAHEAAIDAVWTSSMQPLLRRRFPGTTAEELNRARSFAYGGSVIQDLGYYPFGSKFFSNLLHYVRSGDFVEALVANAKTADEYAFALGALAHHVNDSTGHPRAVNVAVPDIYPKLRARFGDRVTYLQAPKEHVIVEFSFDIVQAAGGAYLPGAYQNFIGFRVAQPLLERTFRQVYGLEMGALFGDTERAIETYRYAISEIIPALTKAAWRDKQDEIAKLTPGIAQADFVFVYRRSDYEREHGANYRKPGIFARFVAFLYRLLPKIGPLKPLSFKAPTPESQALFADSFREASARFRAVLNDLADGQFNLRNTNFDTGRPVVYGEYQLADDTYAELLEKLGEKEFVGTSSALRLNIRNFYGPNPRPAGTKDAGRDLKRAQRTMAAMPR